MDLNILWFLLIAVLFIGFFFLEGFDYGVGILLPFLGKDDSQRRQIINSIGPAWDANEVWLLTAGGAMFAAFPNWYATMFSGFYLALVLMLLALIVRGVAFEFRSKDQHPKWRATWDWCIFFGSFIPALLWGVALGNLVRGVPIDGEMNYVGGFWNLLNPYALLGGLATLTLFTFHGSAFLTLKLSGQLLTKAQSLAKRLWMPAVVAIVLFVVSGYWATDMFTRLGVNPGVAPVIAGAALLAAGYFIMKDRGGWAFFLTGLTIAFSAITLFMGLYPRVMVSSLSDDWSLTIYNASSSPYTLTIMSWIALFFVPIVLGYTVWTYWVFRKRIQSNTELEY